ncbi:MAG: sigma-70 family RNA polymerase sigma factor [Acutalibacteraceae bacterium]|nr:sigma-70 family RNA polymerase sigma factor [Acutalibacteraceae bacterium]
MPKNTDSPDIYKLYTQCSSKVYAVCMSYLHNSDDAEDIMQDTFVTAMRKLDTLNNPEKAERWLIKIAANKCKDYIKKQKPCLIDDENGGYDGITADTQTPEQSYDVNYTTKQLRSAVDELPQNQRDVIVGFYFNQQSIKQLARKLNLTPSAVKSILHRARKSLKTECERREISLNSMGLGGALFMAGAKQAAEKIAAATAGAVAAKIVAGVAAAAIIGYGAVGVAMYTDRESNVDMQYRQEVVDSSPYTHLTPNEPTYISNPKDNSDKYEYINFDSINAQLKDAVPLEFIDDTQLLVYIPFGNIADYDYGVYNDELKRNANYVYDFSDGTLTELVSQLPPITEKPQSIQYMDTNDYYIVYDYYGGKQSDANGRYALHIADNKYVDEEYDFKYESKEKVGIDLSNSMRPNFGNGKMFYFFNDMIYITEIDYYAQYDNEFLCEIKVPGFICDDNVRWVDDNTIEYVYAKVIDNGKFVKKTLVRYDIDTNRSCEQTGFDYMNDFGANTRQITYYEDSISAYNVVSVLNYGANTLTDYKFDGGIENSLRGEYIVCTAVNSSAWSSYINTGEFGGDYTVYINRYNIITEQYETLYSYSIDSNTPEHYPYGYIISPNAERIICNDYDEYKMICRK